MLPRPLQRRVFGLTIRNRKKFGGSILYRPYDSKGSFDRAEDVWIVCESHHCKGWHDGEKYNSWVGQRVLVPDAFELDPTPPFSPSDVESCLDGRFLDLADIAKKVEGDIVSVILTEASIDAIVQAGHPLQESRTVRDGMR